MEILGAGIRRADCPAWGLATPVKFSICSFGDLADVGGDESSGVVGTLPLVPGELVNLME